MPDPDPKVKPRAEEHIKEYLASNGTKGGTRGGQPVLLLTTTGRVSGEPRMVPLMYFPVGDEMMLAASNYGRELVPDWYRNIEKNPNVRLRLGAEDVSATARIATGEERQRLFDHLVNEAAFYGGYQKMMQREIPLVLLKRAS